MKGFQTSPAHSCKDIRDSGDSKGDGKYWIDPEENRNHFRCYCDMTTDGGDLLTIVLIKRNFNIFSSVYAG